MARALNVGFQQLRDAIFAKVGATGAADAGAGDVSSTSTRCPALSHHPQDRRAEPDHRAGREGRRVPAALLLFSVGPLILELALTGGSSWAVVFDVSYLLVLIATIAIYIWFTFKVTEWRVRIRKEMNDQDTDANQKAIDSLLNFETVKYFGAEAARPSATTARWRAMRRPRSRPPIRWRFSISGSR
jgi:ABC-type transport system involved in Fe-S cluster assembly fused permease/ATPase subunit